jgi:uncharacterized protein YjiK
MSIRTQAILIGASVFIVFGMLFYAGLDYFNADYSDDRYLLKDGDVQYNMMEPVRRYDLPGSLREISGLSWLDQQFMACIQDEDGAVFFLDLNSGEIARKLKFGGKGDYEGIAHHGNSFYVLRSDGAIFVFNDSGRDKEKSDKIKTALSAGNNAEGLYMEQDGSGLLVACKDRPGIEHDLEGRSVYELPVPGFLRGSINLMMLILPQAYEDLLRQTGLILIKHKVFKPSGIARHPFTHHIYILSSTGKILLVLDQSGDLLCAVPLNPKAFRQPEGIAFDDRGDLFIASEGKESKGYILKFSMVNAY